MNIYYLGVLLNVSGELNAPETDDAPEIEFSVEKIKYKGNDVTKIYESLDLLDEIALVCKEKIIYKTKN